MDNSCTGMQMLMFVGIPKGFQPSALQNVFQPSPIESAQPHAQQF